MRDRIKHHHVSFKHAFEGFWYALQTQPNFLIHFLAAAVVLIAAYFLGVTRTDVIILVFAILFVLVAEFVNTAIESMVDLITTEWKKPAKIAKDVSAAMVLLASFGAVLVGILVFGSYI